MNILVTGGAGFIGSNIVDRYIECGHNVIVVDNLVSGKKKNLNPDAKFYKLDIRNLKKLEAVFEKENIDIINHHAAQMEVARSVREPVFDANVNIIGGINILECMIKYKVKKIIYSSTGGAVYGEPEYLPCDEAHPIKPISHYGLSKYVMEEYIKLYERLYGIDFCILRYPNVFGPRQNPHGEAGVNAIFILKMLKGETPVIYGDGSCVRDYLYVGDVVDANILVIPGVTVSRCQGVTVDRASKCVYNLGTGVGTDVNTVFKTIAFQLSFCSNPIYKELREGEIWKTYLKSDKIKKELKWSSKISFEEGIKYTIDWFKRNT